MDTKEEVTTEEEITITALIVTERNRACMEMPAMTVSFPETVNQFSEKNSKSDLLLVGRIYHVCQADGRSDTLYCPKWTRFNNYNGVCDWHFKVQQETTYMCVHN